MFSMGSQQQVSPLRRPLHFAQGPAAVEMTGYERGMTCGATEVAPFQGKSKLLFLCLELNDVYFGAVGGRNSPFQAAFVNGFELNCVRCG
jgi:hypothetical protein